MKRAIFGTVLHGDDYGKHVIRCDCQGGHYCEVEMSWGNSSGTGGGGEGC